MVKTVRTPIGALCSKEWSRIPYVRDEQRFMQKWQIAVYADVPLQLSKGGLDLGGVKRHSPSRKPLVMLLAAELRETCHKALLYLVQQEKPKPPASGARAKAERSPQGKPLVLLAVEEGETDRSPAAYRAPLRRALIDDKPNSVRVVVCATDYEALNAASSICRHPCRRGAQWVGLDGPHPLPGQNPQ